jgi:O-antigen/teichoic acid export membrane protein
VGHAFATKSWLKPFRSAGILAAGRAGEGILGLGAVAIAAQALGAQAFGLLVLINTARQLIGGLAKLRSKQFVIRYGARALETNDTRQFQRMLGFAVTLDLISASVAVTILLALMGWVAPLMGLTGDMVGPARLYGTCVIFVALSTSAEALLRLFDRFDRVSLQALVTPTIQIIGGAVAATADQGLGVFLLIWFCAIACGRFVLIVAALQELHRRDRLRGVLRHIPILRPPEPRVWRFVAGTNLANAMTQIREHASVLAVGALLDPGAAGLVRIAQQIGKLPGKPTSKILGPAIVPVLAQQSAAAQHRKRRKTVWRSGLIAGAFGVLLFLILIAFGKQILTHAFEPAFAAAYVPMLVFGIAGVIRMLTFSLSPALVSAGRVWSVLVARASATAFQLTMLGVLIPMLGILGTALAELGAVLIMSGILFVMTRADLARPHDTPLPRVAKGQDEAC